MIRYRGEPATIKDMNCNTGWVVVEVLEKGNPLRYEIKVTDLSEDKEGEIQAAIHDLILSAKVSLKG